MEKFIPYEEEKAKKFMSALFKAVQASELSKRKKSFNIQTVEVNERKNVCGTVHCVGGWFAVANCDLSKVIDFSDGACLMANMLGFKDERRLKDFFDFYSGIWGNGDARQMFGNTYAYANEESDNAGSMRDVYNHWEKVMKRWETSTKIKQSAKK